MEKQIWKKNHQNAGFTYTIELEWYLMFVPNLKFLGAAVPEKSLTHISICITLE